MRRRPPTRLKSTANGRVLTRGGLPRGVDVHVTEAAGGAVEWGPQKRSGAVEVQDGVVPCDVERRRWVELDSRGGDILCDAGVGEEAGRPDHQPLRLGLD